MTTETFTPKTNEQILAKMKEVEKADLFGTITSDLLNYLPFEHAQSSLKDGVTKEQWLAVQKENTVEVIKTEIFDYMAFAWGKANDCRGLSAGRSIDHMTAWLWLLGETKLAEIIQDYDYYGKPQLRAICEKYGWDWKQWDNGEWRQSDGGDYIEPPEQLPVALRLAIAV